MNSISELIKKDTGNMLFVFPHFDDCAFVSSGLIQMANNLGLSTNVSVFYEKDEHESKKEFLKYSKKLGISDPILIKTTHSGLKKDLLKIIKNSKPEYVVTFDPGGVTGNTHHTLLSLTVYDVIKELDSKVPKLLWRIADKEEEKHFGYMPLPFVKKYDPIYSLNLSLRMSVGKIRAIFENKSKVKNLMQKLRMFEWYLLDHSELYYLVNFSKDKLKINYPKIEPGD